jgi:tetratricopeptide (TPR) repeat protein
MRSLASLFRTVPLLAILMTLVVVTSSGAYGQLSELDQIQVAPPMRQVQPPSPTASAKELEDEADRLRSEKAYLDAIDYFRAALVKDPNNAVLYNKMGISKLLLQRYREAGKDFDEAIRRDRTLAEAYNNRGVVNYERQKYRAAIKDYKKASELSPSSASFYSNLGSAYFAQKKFEDASRAYAQAVKLDPDIFQHSSRAGVAAQMASPQDRAHYSYVLAKLYAQIGDPDHSLEYLRKAMEEGYKKVMDAYKDPEFAELRKDERFIELMKERPVALPE